MAEWKIENRKIYENNDCETDVWVELTLEDLLERLNELHTSSEKVYWKISPNVMGENAIFEKKESISTISLELRPLEVVQRLYKLQRDGNLLYGGD